MRPRKSFPPESIRALEEFLRTSKRTSDIKRIQAILMRASADLPIAQIAQLTGLAPATIRTLHSRFLINGISSLTGRPGRGGSRRRGLSDAEEQRIIAEKPVINGAPDVRAIQAAVAAAIGRTVAISTVYRMLARHGWNKPAPRRSRRATREPPSGA
jgi:transposase